MKRLIATAFLCAGLSAPALAADNDPSADFQKMMQMMANPQVMMNPATMMNPMMMGMQPGMWVNPQSYMGMVNPNAYAWMMQPNTYMGWMNPMAYTQMMNPMAYMQMMSQGVHMMDPETYAAWYEELQKLGKKLGVGESGEPGK